MLTSTSTVMKYLLFISNLIFVLTGISMITIGFIIRSATQQYVPVLENDSYITAANLLIFLGVFVFLVAFFGCCGSIKENHCMIFTFSVIMSAIFIAELAVGVTGYMLRAHSTEFVALGLNNTMAQYNKTTNNDITQGWDLMQRSLMCCGTKNYTDWAEMKIEMPLSCCDGPQGTKGVTTCSVDSKTLHKTPCVNALTDLVQSNSSTIGLTGLIIAFIQLLGVVFSCHLARSIRNDYESV